jgi:hypothetical protein
MRHSNTRVLHACVAQGFDLGHVITHEAHSHLLRVGFFGFGSHVFVGRFDAPTDAAADAEGGGGALSAVAGGEYVGMCWMPSRITNAAM